MNSPPATTAKLLVGEKCEKPGRFAQHSRERIWNTPTGAGYLSLLLRQHRSQELNRNIIVLLSEIWLSDQRLHSDGCGYHHRVDSTEQGNGA